MHLLVSVRSVEEANLAGKMGVDLIDLKEPELGSLGAASPDIWQAVVGQWHKRTRVSIALGELPQVSSVSKVPADTDSVKIGLAGCRHDSSWRDHLQDVYDQLPEGVQRVAVHYADSDLADSPSLDDVLEMALQLDCRTFLVDTFNKSGGSVFTHMSTTHLIDLQQRLQTEGLQFALAGSLRFKHLASVVKIQPDIVAVRGVVCHRDRTGKIDAELLHSFRQQLESVLKVDPRQVLSRG
ncbi:(5-formylfuran-3-yl)methyl phosphate synthase [Bremerella sp.]|uniref:(5-formylfuran-3-yl)methyl phosphate synthase n=1 Tax=Bremerella sp. TaxID=2795602 RepID=UPI00391A4C10